MTSRHQTLLPLAITLLIGSTLAGCASTRYYHAQWQVTHGQAPEGIAQLKSLSEQHQSTRYRLAYIQARDNEVNRLLAAADMAQRSGKENDALARFQDVLQVQPSESRAQAGIAAIGAAQRNRDLLARARSAQDAGNPGMALTLVNAILAQSPDQSDALALKNQLEQERNPGFLDEPALSSALNKPVSLEFRNASLGAVLDVLSQASGLNFILDKDLKVETPVTIFARNTSIKDALALVARTAGVEKKVLNENTFLIYPATDEKNRQYQELVVRNFYLGSADPKKMQDMVRTLLGPKSLYVDEEHKILTVRDTPDMLDAIEHLIEGHDQTDPEVILDAEILEISSDRLLNLGIDYPGHASASILNSGGTAGGPFKLNELKHLDSNNFEFTFPDPLAVLNLQKTDGSADILAHPRIRVKNREKAKVVIGDKVPVITTTTNQNSGSVQDSVSYLDVGVTLDVRPEVHVNQDVSVDLSMEVSNIVKEVTSSTGLLTYQIGTRNATTVLRLHDGETQALAGLIRNEKRNTASRIPLLGDIPLIGKLFSNETNNATKTEIVLLLTPHIVRPYRLPDARDVAFASGTGSTVTTTPLRLTAGGEYSSTRSALATQPVTPTAIPANLVTVAPVTPVAGNPSPAVPAPTTPAETPTQAHLPETTVVPAIVSPAAQPVARDTVYRQSTAPMIANPDLRLDLVAPTQVSAGKEFTVTLLLQGKAYNNLALRLALGDPHATLLRVTPINLTGQVAQEIQGDQLTLHFPKSDTRSGALALLTIRAPDQVGASLHVNVMAVDAQGPDGTTPLSVAPTDPKAIAVTP